jgi:hypothetical protein
VAHASLVLVGATPAASFVDLSAQGFGTAPRMLTMQGTGQQDFLTGQVVPINNESGDAIDGANKSSTPLLSTLGWDKGADVGIGFNSDQSGNTGITMQDLVLTIYNGNTAVISFSLGPAFINFSASDLALQQGNGQAVFAFGLDAAQQTQFNTFIAANPGWAGYRAGLASTLGCPAGSAAGCLVTNDGPDSFIGFDRGGPTNVPDSGSTLSLLGAVLLGIGMVRRRMNRF